MFRVRRSRRFIQVISLGGILGIFESTPELYQFRRHARSEREVFGVGYTGLFLQVFTGLPFFRAFQELQRLRLRIHDWVTFIGSGFAGSGVSPQILDHLSQ
jgi:hypothetical protein